MKYRLTAKVVGLLRLALPNHELTAERDGMLFAIRSDDTSSVTEVSITAPISPGRAADLSTRVHPTPPGSPVVAHLVFDDDYAIADQLTGELQHLEAYLGFIFDTQPLERIAWHEAARSLVPETPAEAARVQFSQFAQPRQSARAAGVLTEDLFTRIVVNGTLYRELTVRMAFFMTGSLRRDRGDHVQAFYDFYFVLEDSFADGKTGQNAVLTAFDASDTMSRVCKTIIEKVILEPGPHSSTLRALMQEEQCGVTVRGLKRFMYQIRGRLHHYSRRSTRRHATPFNQSDFGCVSALASAMAHLTILWHAVDINQRAGN